METQIKNRISNERCLTFGRRNGLQHSLCKPIIAALLICIMSLFSSMVFSQEGRPLSQIDDKVLVDETVAGCACNGDVNNDGSIDGLDVQDIFDCVNFNLCNNCINSCDVNCDGVIDQSDVDAADCLVFGGGNPATCCSTTLKCALIGQDCFTTLCDGNTTYDFSNSPIPADFFSSGSDPFTGVVTLGGAGGIPGDTIIRRMQQMCFPDPLPSTQNIPIQIVQMNLVSCSPITVTFNGGLNPESWDVFIRLDQNNPSPPGDMTATKTHANGGSYSANLPVNAAVAFGPSVIGSPTTGFIPVLQVVLSTVCDGVWGQTCCDFGCGSSGFFPGWNQTNPTAPCCQETCHASGIPGHLHCTVPPKCQLCPLDPSEDCNDGIDNNGDGLCDCEDPDCFDSVKCLPTFENWVIAADFKLECAECQCDFDGDGVCTTADFQYFTDCLNGIGTGCERVDYDCNGVINADDQAVFDCLFNSGPAADCCPDQDLIIDRMRWYGSYFDPDFEPPNDGTDPLRRPDSWFVAIHRDIPATACPAPPPGFVPIDLCGTLDTCPNAATFWVFTPDGSANQYNLVDNNNALAGFAAGDEVRICGYIDPTVTSPCTTGIDRIVVNAAMPCHTKVSRPGELVAQWVIDDVNVFVEEPFKVGCDGHRIFCYTSNLNAACLEHDNSLPGEIDAAGVFHPIPGRVYWISFQAVVGMTVSADCGIVKTGEEALQDFWGWHTTPPGYQHLDDAFVGMLHMGCPDEWVYDWVHHLHCSDPTYRDCCQDPTKSIDMAFQLFQGNLTRWNQPVNPGPPTIPLPPLTPIPGGGIDEYPETQLIIQINLPSQPETVELFLTGPTVIARGDPEPTKGTSGQRRVQTEILSMDLSGIDPSGDPLTLRSRPLGSSGKDGIRIGPGGPPYPGTLRVEIEIVELSLRSSSPIQLEAQIWEFPPSNTVYTTPLTFVPVDLIDVDNQVVGSIKFVQHFLPYNGGVNIHSDVSWNSIPTEACCEPNDTADGCTGTCDDPALTCLVTEKICDPANPGTCIVTKCDCIDDDPPEECHLIDVPGQTPPFGCIGDCLSPPWPIGTTCDLITIVNADGTLTFDCDCKPEETGACCDLANNVCFFTTSSNCPAPDMIFHPNEDCDPFGTCCADTDGDGTFDQCQDMAEVCCNDIGGKFHPNSACDPPGLCCYDSDGNGTYDRCDTLARSCCNDTSTNAVWIPNLDCATEPLGECCYDLNNDGYPDSCEYITELCCESSQGVWHNTGDCADDGLCCYDRDGDGINETCDELTRNCCSDIQGSTFTAGVTCAAAQDPCCIDGVCYMLDPTCCLAQGGIIGPPGTVCTTPLACCINGVCSLVDPVCCQINSGVASSLTACPGLGACCDRNTNDCFNGDQLCCSIGGHSAHGVGTACSTNTEGCCMPDGTCQMLDPLCCQDDGGNPQGAGTSCSTAPEACCFSDGTCADLDRLCCQDQGGTPAGPGLCQTDTCVSSWFYKDYNGPDNPGGYMPDYDQNKDYDGDGTVDRFYCGPTAVGNSLWWFSHKFATHDPPVVPPGVDKFGLIQDLAQRMKTNSNGTGTPGAWGGTFVNDMQAGIDDYLLANGLTGLLYEHTEPRPSFNFIAGEVQRSQDVVLLLGFWHVENVIFDAAQQIYIITWIRTGGHYVTVAGVNKNTFEIAISDPDADQAEFGAPGIVRGVGHSHGPVGTGFRDAGYDHRLHNEKGLASHDYYELRPSISPGGALALFVNGSPLDYGKLMTDFHEGDNPVENPGPIETIITQDQLDANGYPIPAFCMTMTEIEFAVMVSPKEACCLDDGTCIDIVDAGTLAQCETAGGTRLGPGTMCGGTQACCLPDSTCSDMDEVCCLLQGGTPQGAGSACSAALEACCMPDDSCRMLDPLCCTDQGGSPQGPGVTCTGVLEACCLPDGTCENIERLCCEDAGGIPQGGGVTCTTNTCAVCEPNATQTGCIDVVCPIAGEKCVPLGVSCDAAGCTVIGCECQPDTCHIIIDSSTSLPACVSGCPTADNVCTLQGIDTDGDGTDDLFRCECAPLPPLPDPVSPGTLACGGGSNYGLACMTCSGGSRNGELCINDDDCPGVGVCLPDNSLCPGASCGGTIAGPGTTLSWPKNRYIGFDANPAWANTMIGIRVTLMLVDGHPNCTGVVRWAGPPTIFFEDATNTVSFNGSLSQGTPHYMDWTTVSGPVQIYGEEVIPNSFYAIQAVDMLSGAASIPLIINTAKWGDIILPMHPFTAATQPTIADVLSIVNKWLGAPDPVKVRSQIQPQHTNPIINVGIADVLRDVDAWLGSPYPFAVSTAVCP